MPSFCWSRCTANRLAITACTAPELCACKLDMSITSEILEKYSLNCSNRFLNVLLHSSDYRRPLRFTVYPARDNQTEKQPHPCVPSELTTLKENTRRLFIAGERNLIVSDHVCKLDRRPQAGRCPCELRALDTNVNVGTAQCATLVPK